MTRTARGIATVTVQLGGPALEQCLHELGELVRDYPMPILSAMLNGSVAWGEEVDS